GDAGAGGLGVGRGRFLAGEPRTDPRYRPHLQRPQQHGISLAWEAALLEMGLWVRDGATPWQTLVAATHHGAEVCGVGTELGTVEVGKLADLIVVGANPLEDITNVRRLQLVLKEGRIVSDKRHLNDERVTGGFRVEPAGGGQFGSGLLNWP